MNDSSQFTSTLAREHKNIVKQTRTHMIEPEKIYVY